MTLRRAVVALLLLVAGRPVAAQGSGAPAQPAVAPSNSGAAMYEFLLARRAEGRDEVEAAEAGLKKAIALDPASAELQAELGAFYVRQNRAADAVAAAERALALDPDVEEGHRVLGLVNAAWADGIVDGPADGSEERWRDTAITELQKLVGTPTMATDLGLQMTYARQLVAAERYADAVPVLERLVSQTGPAGEPASVLAEAHRALGQFDRAEAVLERAAEVNPRYYLALGDVYERQRKYEEAADAFDKGARVLKTRGRELKLRRAAALLNVADGKGVDRAIAELTQFVDGAPKDAAAHYLLARAYGLRNDSGGLEKAARQALEAEPRHLPTLALLATHYRDRYDFAAVEALLAPLAADGALDKAPPADAVRLLAELGGARQQIGDAAGAVQAFERASRLLPDAPPLATALAQAYLAAGQPAEAARVAAAARKSSPDDLGLIRVQAIAAVREGRATDAVSAAETAVGDRRLTTAGAFALADVYQEAKRQADAVSLLEPLATAAPDDDAVAFRLAAAYENAGRIADAERTFRRILRRDPLNANTLNYLGYMLANHGQKVPEALTLVDRALAVEPGNPAFLDSRGWALFKLGRAAEAEEPLRRAATALRGSSVIQSHHADVLLALGRRDEAADRLELALRGDGVDIDRTAIERRLQQLGRRPR
ncbi:MAG: tetratricopeptide repeat protein [Vicinamibacterales bacterium]